MPNRILALDLQGADLVAVTVETSFRGYRFVGQHAEPRDPARPLAEQLREFVSRHGLTGDTVLSALPGSLAAYRILSLPFRDRRRLQQTVPFELESLVPFSLEDAIVDFQVLRRGPEGATVFAALTPRRSVEEHLTMLSDAGLDPAIVDFAPLTTLNVLQLFEGERPERYAFLHLNSGRGTLALYHGGELEALRVLDVAGEPLTAALAREVYWSLQSFGARNGSGNGGIDTEPLPLLLGGSTPAELPDVLQRQLGLTVQRLEDLPLRHISEEFRGRQGAFAPAIGLALREIADAPTLGLNFRRDEFAYHRGQEELRDALVRLGALAGVVFALFLLSAWVSYHRLANDYDTLRASVREVFQKTLPERQAVQDEVLELSQEIENVRKRREQLGGGPLSALEILREVSVRAPQNPRANVEELTLDAEALRLRAKTASFEAVEGMKRSVAESRLFRDVQVKDPRTTPDGTVEFRLNVLFGKGEEP